MFDQAYVSSLVKTVLHNIYTDTSGTLVLGTVAIPTPSANVGKLCLIAYVSSLVKTVLHNIYTDTSGTLVLGTVAIPTPPANVGKL